MTQNPSSKTAVLVNFERFDPDSLTAAVVLAKAVARIDKSVVQLLWNDHVPAKLDTWVNLQNVELAQYTSQTHPMITLQNINAQVSELKWVQKDNKLEIEILTTAGAEMASGQIAIQANTLPYSTIYLMGNFDLKQIVQALGVADAESLDDVKLVSVSKAKSDQRLPGESFVYEAATFAEVVFRFLTTRGIEISNTELTELLQSIYNATNLLRSHKVDAGTLENVRGLLEAGATHPLAVRRAANMLDPETAKLWAAALTKVEVSSMLIAVAKLDQPIPISQVATLRAATVASPLQFMSNVKATFLLAPIEHGSTWVCASSNLRELNLGVMFGEYDLSGDSLQAQFIMQSNPAEAWDLINKQINKALSSKPNPFTNAASPRQPERPMQKSMVSQSRPSNSAGEAVQPKPALANKLPAAQPASAPATSHFPKKEALGPKIIFPTKSFEKPAVAKLPPETHMPKIELEEAELPVAEPLNGHNVRGLMAVGEMGDDLDIADTEEIDPLAPISDEELDQLISRNENSQVGITNSVSSDSDPLPAAV